MYTFIVEAMTCGGCAAALTRAIQRIDASAKVNATLENHRVEVETHLGLEELLAVFEDAGFPAQPA